ncbi:IS1182 family transposase [Streptomyces sp. NPDC059999]|uniref:IS1182 family transposase n=1 Tax=Streptomyces sp. NPDC059999 TaxID=3347030 RepID=UPI0036B6CFEF
MSMRPDGFGEIPAETVRVARAAFPKGSLAIRVRDELGVLFRDEEFADLFPAQGKPAWSPGRLALVLVLQFVEGLTDRQAAESVRARIDFKYALGLDLGDPGFDFSVLSEFRDRLVGADAGRRVLDGILATSREKGLLKTAGRARTDSTHVESSARALNWLEMVTETLRSALNVLAEAAPDWVREVSDAEWFRHYASRAEDSRFPQARAKRDAVGQRIGDDGLKLLTAVFSPAAPQGLAGIPEVEILRQVWVQHFHLVDGEVRRRDPKDRPPGALRLVTPYDIEARACGKRDILWDGYKVHLTETCEPGSPNLITNVATTMATVADSQMVGPIHDDLAQRDCLPGEHWVDAGYATAGTLVAAGQEHGIALQGPMKASTNDRAGDPGGYGQEVFAIHWDLQKVACPGGKTSTNWSNRLSQNGLPVVRVLFSARDCRPCPVRRECTNSEIAPRRELRLRHRDEHHALHAARQEQKTDQWKERYQIRAGVEGTISQGIQRCSLRRSRYRGLAKTSLQHQLTGAAINLARINAHLTGQRRAPTRISPYAALRPAGSHPAGRS